MNEVNENTLKWVALLFAALSTGGSFFGSVLTASQHDAVMESNVISMERALKEHDERSHHRLERIEESARGLSERVSLIELRVMQIEDAHSAGRR